MALFAPFSRLNPRQRHAFAACFLGWSLDIAEHIGSYGRVLAGTVLVVALFLAAITAFGRESRGVALSTDF